MTTTGFDPAALPDQTGRTALVTGANSGLGLHTSIGLARAGARVLLACRNPARAADAAEQVRAAAPGAQVDLVRLDLASLMAVTAAADEVAALTDRVDAVVCNAGVMALPKRLTADGFERQLGTNHLATSPSWAGCCRCCGRPPTRAWWWSAAGRTSSVVSISTT